jgi:hypothetical protein
MGDTRRFDDLNREKRLHKVKSSKNKLDKHRKLIYNVVSSRKEGDTFDEFLEYDTYKKIKRR